MRGGYIKYALIGLAPYSFHYDESKTSMIKWRTFQYLIAFNDLHNFPFTADECRKMFREKFLNIRLPTDQVNPDNMFNYNQPKHGMMPHTKVVAWEDISRWSKKNYPATVRENVQILDDYLTLCEKNNVRPIMFLPPMTEGYQKYFNSKMLDEFYYLIHEANNKHQSAVFLDGWKWQVFSDKDFYNVSHMNTKGAAKFSAILNNVIENLEKG